MCVCLYVCMFVCDWNASQIYLYFLLTATAHTACGAISTDWSFDSPHRAIVHCQVCFRKIILGAGGGPMECLECDHSIGHSVTLCLQRKCLLRNRFRTYCTVGLYAYMGSIMRDALVGSIAASNWRLDGLPVSVFMLFSVDRTWRHSCDVIRALITSRA
jgi:hypothetical protein